MVAARPMLIWSLVLAVCLAIAWLVAARHIALFLDRFITLNLESLPSIPLGYDVANLRIGKITLPLIGTDNQRFNLAVQTDSQNRLVLSKGGQSFVLGPRLSAPDPAGRPDLDFASEPGDKLSLRLERSALSQPTLFEFNFLGGSVPLLRRHVYYRLAWKKRSGAQLEMLWRFEQQYYRKTGWTKGNMMYDFMTGLLRVEVSP